MVVYTLEQRWAKWACDRLTENTDFDKKKIIFSDVYFDLSGKENCRIWGTENPHTYIEKPTHRKRVIVWCGFWSRGIIGPFFFENEQREAVVCFNFIRKWQDLPFNVHFERQIFWETFSWQFYFIARNLLSGSPLRDFLFVLSLSAFQIIVQRCQIAAPRWNAKHRV